MAASEFRVHPQVAHAHEATGAMDTMATAMGRRLERNFITDSRAHHRERYTTIEPTFPGTGRSPYAVSRGKFNSGESGRSAWLMRARGPRAARGGLECDGCERRRLPGRLEDHELRCWTAGRSAAERAILEMSMRR